MTRSYSAVTWPYNIFGAPQEFLIVQEQEIKYDLQNSNLELFRRTLYLADKQLKRAQSHILRLRQRMVPRNTIRNNTHLCNQAAQSEAYKTFLPHR